MFIVRVWQVEGALVWFPTFDQGVIESGCHLANEVTGPRPRQRVVLLLISFSVS